MTASRNEADYPYSPTNKLEDIHLYSGPDRLRWVPDRGIAQVLLDLWHNMQERDAKRRAKVTVEPSWNERGER